MGFSKNTKTEREEGFNLSNSNDRRVIDEFEKELDLYESRAVTVLKNHRTFKRVLSGFELYLHENGIYCYSAQYPLGIFLESKLPEYRFLKLKKRALDNIRYSRVKADENRKIQTDSLITQMAM